MEIKRIIVTTEKWDCGLGTCLHATELHAIRCRENRLWREGIEERKASKELAREKRDEEIFQLVIDGLTFKEVAKKQDLSYNFVRNTFWRNYHSFRHRVLAVRKFINYHPNKTPSWSDIDLQLLRLFEAKNRF